MPRVGFEHTIQVFDRVKPFYALYRTSTPTLERILLEWFNQSAWIEHDKEHICNKWGISLKCDGRQKCKWEIKITIYDILVTRAASVSWYVKKEMNMVSLK
jgi:hypothetical protein